MNQAEVLQPVVITAILVVNLVRARAPAPPTDAAVPREHRRADHRVPVGRKAPAARRALPRLPRHDYFFLPPAFLPAAFMPAAELDEPVPDFFFLMNAASCGGTLPTFHSLEERPNEKGRMSLHDDRPRQQNLAS